MIVMELCTGGSLFNILDDPENSHGLEEKEFLLVLHHLGEQIINIKKVLVFFFQRTFKIMTYIYIQTALTAVCGKSDCLNTPFVTRTFHYILGICNHKYTLYYLVYPYLFFIKCIFMS